jgi:glutathione synthase/RimK-type ligase-like ATP-grasp enzyme
MSSPTSPPRIAIATCRSLPEPDPDELALVGALARAGAWVRLLAWDGDAPLPAPGDVDLVLVRSTWNYARNVEAFVAWLRALEPRAKVANPVPVLLENVDKIYLRGLAARGIPTVPTAFVDRGDARTLAAIRETHGFSEVVVKPRVSAGSWKTMRFPEGAPTAEQELGRLVAERDVMVQPYVASVDGYGERSIVVIDGRVSHAVRKSPRFSGDSEAVVSVPIADDERAFAERVIASYEGLLYARVDVARDASFGLLLMELELLEPSLFFREAPSALDAFVAAIVREATRG